MDVRTLLYVGGGGAAGCICRYAAGIAVGRLVSIPWPVATFSINIAGSFIIGLLAGLALRGNTWLTHDGGMLLLATGFCGGFTTFSTFALENIQLMQRGQLGTAFAYSIISVVCGLLLCRAGIALTS